MQRAYRSVLHIALTFIAIGYEDKKEKKKNIFVNINNTISDKPGLRGLRSEF